MIVDAFTFYNELDILEIRLSELSGVVDRFVLVEADRTFRGAEKPLYFAENRQRFAGYLDKIEYISVKDMPLSKLDPWAMESHQRRCISRGLTHVPSDALIMISDVDEIPRPEAVESIINLQQKHDNIYIFEQTLCYHYLNWKHRNSWYGTRALTRRNLLDPQATRRFSPPKGSSFLQRFRRNLRWKYRTLRYCARVLNPVEVTNGGWHFSYIGDPDFVRNKIRSFSHAEHDTDEIIGDGVVEKRISSGRDLFGGIPSTLPIQDLPKTVQEDMDRYVRLIDQSRILSPDRFSRDGS